MSLLARRQRCPHCAELIQAKAVKCRYCLSDLTLETPEGEPVQALPPGSAETRSEREPEAEVESSRTVDPDATAPDRGRLRSNWFAGAMAACTILAAVSGWIAHDTASDADRLEDRRAARDEVRSVISEPIETLLSYDYRTLDRSNEEVAAVLAPSFREEYSATFDELRREALADRVSQVAYVVGVSTVSYDVDRVKALLFVNTLASSAGTQRKKLLQNRMLVTMVRDDDDWLIGDITIPVV
jgi:Mce-associated membrane protein